MTPVSTSSHMTYTVGVDISTQTVRVLLVGVAEREGLPSEIVFEAEWTASRPYGDGTSRSRPDAWVALVRECLQELKSRAPETGHARAVGVSTTFPGVFPVLEGGRIDPALVSLYDNTLDAGVLSGRFEAELGQAEAAALNRMWPGTMTIGLIMLVNEMGLRLEDVEAILPPNTALACALLRAAGREPNPRDLPSDFTQTVVSGIYDARAAGPAPAPMLRLLEAAAPAADWSRLRSLLPRAGPAWRNVLSCESIAGARDLLGLPELEAVTIGAGDSALGSLAVLSEPNAVINVRGSSDSAMIIVDAPRPCRTTRESLLHYPQPDSESPDRGRWAAVAPMLRSGRVWDWVKRLRFEQSDADADAVLEQLAAAALKRRLCTPKAAAVRFSPALGGERAPDWDPAETGAIAGIVESHDLGDIALAALEGLSVRLGRCIESVEERYEVKPATLILVGGPTRNRLWNWITQVFTGKATLATSFADVSLVGAALIGWAALWDGELQDAAISERLRSLARHAAAHPLIRPSPVVAPDDELGAASQVYEALAKERS